MSHNKATFKKTTARVFTFIASCVIMAALLLTACGPAVSTDAPLSPNSYMITGAAVVDVEKGIVFPDQAVIIDDGLIQAVGPRAELSAPRGTHVINGQGLYLMPGLVDAHVHYVDPAVFGRVMIANGVLLVRDMGMPTDYILKLRDELNRGETLGPEMIAAGAILDGSPPLIPSISMGLKTPEEGRAAVRKQAEAGVNMIKVYSNLDTEVFLAIVDEAQKLGLKVVGHVPDTIYIEDAAAAGLRSIEHWFGFEKVMAKLLGEPVSLNHAGMSSGADYLSRLGEVDSQALQDFYQRLRASGVTVVPTVVTFKNAPNVDALESQSLPSGEYISQNLLSMWKSQWAGQSEFPDLFWQNWAQMVKEMNKVGVPLMVGTDLAVPGIIPGYSVHEEMAIWQEAGIPPADVLRSATLVPVQFMGLEDRLGTVAEGKAASLVLVKANPLEDIRNAQLVEAVFLRGKYYSRDDLNQLLSEAREAASSNPIDTAAPTATPISTLAPVSVPTVPAERPATKGKTAVEAIREFVGSPELPVTYIGTGTHSENSSMAVEEYESADATFMVEQQNKLVVYMQKKNWDPSNRTALSGDELERIVRAFLAARNPCFGTAEDLLKFTSSGKVGNRFFRWQSLHPDTIRPLDQPAFIQVGISADGTIFGYVDSGICELARNRPAHVTPIPTDTPTPTPEPQCQLAVTTTAGKHPGWVQCTNVKYGFSFQYPSDWHLQEIVDPINTSYGHAVYLTPLTDPAVRMIIAFKRANEDRRIAPTGIGSGDLITRGAVSLLGQDVERNVLVALGKDMAVYYGWPRSVATGNDLVFWLALDCACSASDPAAAGLTPDVEQIADAIVESIEVK